MLPDVDSLRQLELLDRRSFVRLLDFVLNPKLIKIELSECIVGKSGPQACVESIDVENLCGICGLQDRDKCLRLFLLVDQAVSIMPRCLVNKIRRYLSAGFVNDIWDILYDWCSKVLENIEFVKVLKSRDLKAEDDFKQHILLVVPSEKHFRKIRHDPDTWLWRSVAYDGSSAPSAIGWFRDVERIVQALSREGVRATVFVDDGLSNLAEDLRYVPRCDVKIVDIPEDVPKICYVRDPSITILGKPLLCNMVLDLRRGEEEVMSELYTSLQYEPLLRVRWGIVDGRLERAFIEGGNIFLIRTEEETLLLSGIGIRGTNYAAVKFLAEVLPEDVRIILIPIVSYIRDWEKGAVHLDVAFAYIGAAKGLKLCLIDSSRVCIYSALEYDREKQQFKIIELLRLFKELDIHVDEPPADDKVSRVTMLNFLNLGNGKIIADKYNHTINKYLEKEYGIDVIEVEIPQIEAGGGGVRCATRDIWI